MTRILKAALLLALPAFTACQAVGIACTEVGCSGALTVELQGTLDAGVWDVEITKDGQTLGCTLSYPGEPVCEGVLTATASDVGMTVTWTTSMGEAGESVTVVLSKDGTEILNETLVPTWDEPWYPNGKACDNGNGCQAGEVSITF